LTSLVVAMQVGLELNHFPTQGGTVTEAMTDIAIQ
jgi:hypothetical protein